MMAQVDYGKNEMIVHLHLAHATLMRAIVQEFPVTRKIAKRSEDPSSLDGIVQRNNML
jgi:hypothetical protein